MQAFDIANHNLLLHMVSIYEFDLWLERTLGNSFLLKRLQFVAISTDNGDYASCEFRLSQGVLQESVLGPRLFMMIST